MGKFRFKKSSDDVRVRDDIWKECREMTKRGHTLHGRMQFAEFISESKARVTFTNAKGKVVTRVLEWDSVRWSNLRNEDRLLEPERRAAYARARAKAIAELPQGTDERIVEKVVPAIDPDAAHHRLKFPRPMF